MGKNFAIFIPIFAIVITTIVIMYIQNKKENNTKFSLLFLLGLIILFISGSVVFFLFR